MLSAVVVCVLAVGTVAVYGITAKNEISSGRETKTATNSTTTAVSDLTIDYRKAGAVGKNFVEETEASKNINSEKTTAKAVVETSAKTKTTTVKTTTTSVKPKTTKASVTSKKAQTTKQIVNTYSSGTVNYTSEEFEMMCYVLQNEAGYLSESSKIAVSNVILNRVKSPNFPNSISGVLTSNNQFTSIRNYYNRTNPPTQNTRNCVQRALKGEDNSNGAVYYYAPKYCGGSSAQWFESLNFCMELEGQRFFK
ncbi:MAG: cell wall hydrolase [Oscillospiraceae bacterium]